MANFKSPGPFDGRGTKNVVNRAVLILEIWVSGWADGILVMTGIWRMGERERSGKRDGKEGRGRSR